MTDIDKLIKSCQTCLHNNVCKFTDEELCKGTKVKYLITDCKDYFANGVTVNEWISVEDRLPEPMEWVLCFCSTNVVHILRLDDYGHYWTAQSLCKHYKKEYVTHWMPLPQPPKEVE